MFLRCRSNRHAKEVSEWDSGNILSSKMGNILGSKPGNKSPGTRCHADANAVCHIIRYWLRQNRLLVEGDQFCDLSDIMTAYSNHFRLIEHEWFKLSDDGMSCIKKVASSGEANVLAGRQKYAGDPTYAESGLILFGHSVAENRSYSQYQFELKLEEPFKGNTWAAVGVCILDEGDYYVTAGGSNPYGFPLKLHPVRSLTIYTNDKQMHSDTLQPLESYDRFQVTVDSKFQTLKVRNIANGRAVVSSYFEPNGSPNLKRPRLSFISHEKGTRFTITRQSWMA